MAASLALSAAPDSPEDLLHRAEVMIQEENFTEAVKLLAAATQADPQNTRILYQRGYAYFRQRKLDDAKQDFANVVKLAPPALHSRYFLGRIALLKGLSNEAVDWLAPVAAAKPPIFDAAAQLGKAYLNMNQLANARKTVLEAIQLAPWDGSLHYVLARIYQGSSESVLAMREFAATQRLKANDQIAVTKLLECSAALKKGDKNEALRVRDDLLAEPTIDPDALVALGMIFADAGFHEESLTPFQAAARKQPGLFQAQYNAGLALLRLDRFQEAEATLRRSIELLPRSPEANSALALSYVLRGQYRESIGPLAIAYEVQPENRRVASLLGTAYLRTGDAPRAVPVLRRAAARDANASFLLIEALNATEDQAGALAVAQETVRLFPDSPRAYLAEAQQLARLGRYQEAGPLFAKAIELAPNQLESLLGLAEVQQKGGMYAASLETYDRALELDPGNTTASIGSAQDLVRLQRLAEARDRLEKALTLHGDEARLHFELSRVYARLGDNGKAAEETRILHEIRERDNPVR